MITSAKISKKTVALLASMIVAVAWCGIAYAENREEPGPFITKENEMGEVVLPEEKKNIYAAGDTVISREPIHGDIYAAATSLTIKNTVSGDIALLGQSGIIDGTVEGDVRMLGEKIETRGKITGETFFVGSDLLVTEESEIQKNLTIFATKAVINGTVNGDVWFSGKTLAINGEIKGDVHAKASSDIAIHQNAIIQKNLRYESGKREALSVFPEAEIRGETEFIEAKKSTDLHAPIGSLIFFIVAGLLSYFALRKKQTALTRIDGKDVLRNSGIGLAAIIASPILMVILIEIPGMVKIAIAVILPILTLIAGGVIVAPAIIGSVIQQIHAKGSADIALRYVLLGGIVLFVISLIVPVLYFFIALACITFFTGTVLRYCVRYISNKSPMKKIPEKNAS